MATKKKVTKKKVTKKKVTKKNATKEKATKKNATKEKATKEKATKEKARWLSFPTALRTALFALIQQKNLLPDMDDDETPAVVNRVLDVGLHTIEDVLAGLIVMTAQTDDDLVHRR